MKNQKKYGLILIVALLILAPTWSMVWSEDETKLISSAEKVVEAWGKLFSKDVDIVSYVSSEYWKVRRYKLVDGTLGYDIKKTDSLVSPYILIVNFKVLFMDNDSSPNARGVYAQDLKKWYGFRTAEEALNNTKPIDFATAVTDNYVKIHYAYQKGNWILRGGNRFFDFSFSEHLNNKEHGNYFKDLLIISVD